MRVKEFTSKFKEVYCYDLKSATDRLPADLQEEILSVVIGKDLAKLWYDIMVKRTFHYGKKSFTYNVGQPMGAYSSWPIMALTHHIIVLASGAKNYALLGDDICLVGTKTAKKYIATMSSLGVEISLEKSVVPTKDSKRNNTVSAEFAKRIFRDGVEISPIPPKLIFELNKPNIFLQAVQYLERTCSSHDETQPSNHCNLGKLLDVLYKEPTKQLTMDVICFPLYKFKLVKGLMQRSS